ncbi:hypothetical protein BN946_scf184950.g12 [Trametes cinnabarina]|uniref:Helicase ATP-binding domain-containing protein n=1 Tax=Pycnoporus cinnabarinus TaxID=5643 RepID=A0A060SQY5_PYCCI|nr:hypothetical protein BN946_scf184950.g12 [Trametes cinnabarina]
MPLLFRPDGIQVIITPLNVLGEQNTRQLQAIGVRAIAISGKNANAKNFEAISHFQYRVVVTNPEQAFQAKGGFGKLWRNQAFRSRLISVVWDEAHCVKSWESFRKDYEDAGRLRNLLTEVPYYLPSATLPRPVLDGVLNNLHVQRSRVKILQRSNDRPNVYLTVKKMQHAASSFKDLVELLIPRGWKSGDRLSKFLVFFNKIEESHQAADVLQASSPPYLALAVTDAIGTRVRLQPLSGTNRRARHGIRTGRMFAIAGQYDCNPLPSSGTRRTTSPVSSDVSYN